MSESDGTGTKPNLLLDRIVKNYSSVKLRLDNHKQIPSGCWEYQGYLATNGYGRFSVGGIKVYAHRASYAFHFLQEPGEFLVCHSCDNPTCINPGHLFLGTCKDNMQDMIKKGRGSDQGGMKNGNCKLEEKDVIEIRRLSALGLNNTQIAKRYGIKHGTVYAIKTRKSWAHVA